MQRTIPVIKDHWESRFNNIGFQLEFEIYAMEKGKWFEKGSVFDIAIYIYDEHTKKKEPMLVEIWEVNQWWFKKKGELTYQSKKELEEEIYELLNEVFDDLK